MRDAAGEHAQAFELLRFLHAPFEVEAVAFRPALVGEILERGEAAARLAVGVPQRHGVHEQFDAASVRMHHRFDEVEQRRVLPGNALHRQFVGLQYLPGVFDVEMLRGHVGGGGHGDIGPAGDGEHLSQRAIGPDVDTGAVLRDADADRQQVKERLQLVHMLLERGIQASHFGFGLLARADFVAQTFVGRGEIGGAFPDAILEREVEFPQLLLVGQKQGGRGGAHERDRRGQGQQGRDRLGSPRESVDGIEERPYFEQVGRAAGHNEGAKHHEQGAKRDIAPLADKGQQAHGDGQVRESDDEVGERVDRHHEVAGRFALAEGGPKAGSSRSKAVDHGLKRVARP